METKNKKIFFSEKRKKEIIEDFSNRLLRRFFELKMDFTKAVNEDRAIVEKTYTATVKIDITNGN